MKFKFFKNWDAKNKIITPVLVNLISAFVLFWFIVLFKEPMIELLKSKAKDYPIYCVAEPYMSQDGILMAELYIINLKGDNYTEKDLREILKAQELQISPDIKIVCRYSGGKITNIIQDQEFNSGKGDVQIMRPKEMDGEWRITVKEIVSKAIFKLIIVTDYKIKLNRASKASLPLEITYPGD